MRCVTEPVPFSPGGEPWCKVGEIESNLAYKYRYADPDIEALCPPPQPIILPEDPGDNPSVTAALVEFKQLRAMQAAELRSLMMGKVITDHIIELGLATNAEEAGEVLIEDVLKAETARALS